MRVRMLTGLSGPSFSLVRGDEREFSQEEAIRLIDAGYAVPVEGAASKQAVKPVADEARRVKKPARGKQG